MFKFAFSLLLLPLISSAEISQDNILEWLSGNQNQPFVCGNDNCEFFGIQNQSYKNVPVDAVVKYYPFQDFSDKLTLEMENEFDGFIFVNTSEGHQLGCTVNPLEIPSQYGRIIWKDTSARNQSVFVRTEDQKITGINENAIRVVPGLDESFLDGRNVLNPRVMKFLMDNRGKNYFPVSTGTLGNIARTMTPSGIFSVDYSYTSTYRNRTEANPFEHMPNTILADARYGDNYQNRKFAFGVHGTPEVFVNCKKSFPNGLTINPDCPPCPPQASINISGLPAKCIDRTGEQTLGVKRDSAGCIRTYIPASKVISNWAWTEMKHPSVTKLNPNINIPSGKLPTQKIPGMKILIIPFSGYVGSQSCKAI